MRRLVPGAASWIWAVVLSVGSTVLMLALPALTGSRIELGDLTGLCFFVAPGYVGYLALAELAGMSVNVHNGIGAIILGGFVLNTLFWLMIVILATLVRRYFSAKPPGSRS